MFMFFTKNKLALAVVINVSVWGLGGVQSAQAGLFSDYATDAQAFRSSLIQPSSDTLFLTLEKKQKSKDAILFLLEKARLQQSHQQYEDSKQSFEAAFALLDEKQNQAKISASAIGYKALSLVSNDSVVPYNIPGYEQVLAHVSQAINFLALNNPEGAAVEMRIAQRIQREIELDHSKEAEKAEKAAKKDSKTPPEDEENDDKYEEAFAGLSTIAGKVKNTYQNAYAFYMAATLWEALGEHNDALVDYKKAYELQPDNYIKQDVTRLDAGHKQAGASYPVVVFLEQGLIPQKVPASFAFPTTDGLINISYASYDPASYITPVPATILVDGRQITTTNPLSDIGALAVKTLKEAVIGNMATQIARSTAKYAVQKEMGNRLGIFGQLAGNLYNTATEKADTRAWNTLPGNAQVARFLLPAGNHTLELVNGAVRKSIDIEVSPNHTTFVHGIEANEQMAASSFKVGQQ
ncbi:COG3014 family protein [Alkanindiges sp. WGS2144]|uniref:COG3014 family protein n=1 Tax=Alkanindiges sp. WGS2144 TaxID=3366808 RepID=UPI00375192B0